ncbi:ABC transporter substrate-binding protein [Roseomonas chloroacetimidivorans]|uniref:ABC transporter substrate-binding protein n=1 Tax=Roseomonas chloroacetimidivorans TaxID=1766656 RepID=UPI003C78573A
MMTHRRTLLTGIGASLLAAPYLARAQGTAAGTTVKMGALKLIHSISPHFYERFTPAGMKVEVIPFESPTEGKNAVVTGSVDFGVFGIAAAILGAAAREPVVVVGSCCDKGMAIIAKSELNLTKFSDLRGRRVGIWPGSTQEVFFLERLRMEGMTIRDVQSVRVSFNEMPIVLARGDVDAYVGAEPGPGLSIASGAGKLLEYPYSTPMGALNMIFATHADMVRNKPDLVRAMLQVHRQASEYGMAHPKETIEMAVQKLGMRRDALEISIRNVDLNWQMTPAMIQSSKTYAEHMLSLRQIRAAPDFGAFFETRFSDELARSAA